MVPGAPNASEAAVYIPAGHGPVASSFTLWTESPLGWPALLSLPPRGQDSGVERSALSPQVTSVGEVIKEECPGGMRLWPEPLGLGTLEGQPGGWSGPKASGECPSTWLRPEIGGGCGEHIGLPVLLNKEPGLLVGLIISTWGLPGNPGWMVILV